MKNGKLRNVTVHDPGPMPPPATFCKHCNQSFPVSVPIIGAPIETGFVQTTSKLAAHIQSKHPDLVQADVAQQMNASIACSAQLVLNHFQSTDEGLMKWRDRERHRIFRAMLVRSAPSRISPLSLWRLQSEAAFYCWSNSP